MVASFETRLDSYAVGEDGKAGIRGRLVFETRPAGGQIDDGRIPSGLGWRI